jgi:hypothetical protein
MALSSAKRWSDRTPDEGPELTPLVTDEARGFLEGRITAKDYSDFVRRHAAREAERDLALHPSQHASPGRTRNHLLVLLAVVTGYGIVGVVLSSNQGFGLPIIAAMSVGAISGTAAVIVYESLHKRR